MGWNLIWQIPLGIAVYLIVVLPFASMLGSIIHKGNKDIIEHIDED